MRTGNGSTFYPEMASLTDGQLEEELDKGRVYRLNDRFFKFLFGREDRKTLFLDLVNTLVFPDGAAGFTGFEYANRELSATRDEGKACSLDIVAVMADGNTPKTEYRGVVWSIGFCIWREWRRRRCRRRWLRIR